MKQCIGKILEIIDKLHITFDHNGCAILLENEEYRVISHV